VIEFPKLLRSGKSCVVIRLTDDEFLPKLEKKLTEEVQEYASSRSIEELADLIEIIYRIIELGKIRKEEFEKIRLNKLRARAHAICSLNSLTFVCKII